MQEIRSSHRVAQLYVIFSPICQMLLHKDDNEDDGGNDDCDDREGDRKKVLILSIFIPYDDRCKYSPKREICRYINLA